MNRSELTAARIQALADSLSDRDRAVLDTLSRTRLATGAQLERLHFTDVGSRERRRVLSALVDKHLLYRLARVIGGTRAGSSGYVFALGTTGQRVRGLRNSNGRPPRPWTPGTTFLQHSVAVTEVYVQLIEAQQRDELKVHRFEGEPACWRHFLGAGAARLVLRPDAYIELGINGHRDHWFLEVDLATESSSTLHRKCEMYRSFWTGRQGQAEGDVFPLVLFAVKDEKRKGVLLDVLGRQPAESWPLFTLCLLDRTVERLRRGAAS
jgi:hypothetical protein